MVDTRLEDRIRAVEAEVEGEKHVTRHVLEQVRRATAEIAAVRVELTTLSLRFDNLAGTVSLAMSALTAHGTQLNILLQDVAKLRNEVASIRQDMATRQEMAAMRQEMTVMREEAAVRYEALLAAIHALGGGAASAQSV